MCFICNVNKMILRTFFPLCGRFPSCSMSVNMTTVLAQRKQMSSLVMFSQHLVHKNYCFLSVRKYIMLEQDLKFSNSLATKEGKKLSDVIAEDLDIDKRSNKELKKIVAYLLSKGYTRKDIREKFLVHLNSRDISCAKFNFLEDIDSDIELLLPLLSLPKSILKLAAQNSRTDRLDVDHFPNRIHYLSYHLELKPSELVPALAKHSALLTMNFRRLNCKMNILKNANISSKYIVKDLWIFNYKEELIASRIQAALKARVELKPWMLRCSEKTFQSILIKNSESQRILGNESVHSYLAKRLDCSIEYIDYLMARNKLLKSINISKLHQIINFLYEKGYTPQEVRLFPRVFCSSVQSLEKRFEELQQFKSTLPTIAQLCMSKKKASLKLKQDS